MPTTLPIETQPVAVTVFPDRARVTRAGIASLPAGTVHLVAGNLPLALLPDSVRANGQGTARARLLGVTTNLENFVDTPAEWVRDLERQIQELEDADADLAARAAVAEKEQKYLEGLAAQSEMFARGLALRNRTPEEQAAIFDFVSGRSRALQAEALSLGRDRRERAKELDRLRRELRAAQSARPRQRYTAVAELEVDTPGEFRLEITYVVTGAHWAALYDLRVTESGAELAYLAQVAQNTGEDWPAVALTLSTARPSLSLSIPELDPWYIEPRVVIAEPKRARAAGPLMAMAAAPQPAPMAQAAGTALMREEAPSYDLAADTADVSEAGVSLNYRLPGAADVPGNNEPRKVTIASVTLTPEFTYITAPKLEPVVYRRAMFRNDSAYSLLPGRMQLFEGEEYLGATGLEFVAPGQSFELALGADERLRVERELAARAVEKASLIGDRRRIGYGYTIEVENLRDTAQVVVVRDHIPVARDEQIKVRLEQADPKSAEQSELGQLEWKLTLAPKTKRVIRFDFTVEFPRAMNVMRLP